MVEGICLVATPALIRDFSPQVGRATAMGFWTSGPVLGSLIVSVVGTITIPAVIPSSRFWTHEYVICGIAGLVVFVVALIGLRELSPRLRDQLMVTMQDRVLIEARAKGIDLAAALKNPFRQLLKADIVVSALAISLMLLIYYTAVGFATILFQTVFGFTTQQANGLGNWNWGFNVIAVIGIGIISDKLRVRKPFMIFGAVLAAFMTVVYLNQIGHHPSYYTLAIIIAVLSLGLGIAYTPWMASFTETVEDRNPALTATGLAIWGWIIRIVIAVSFLILPHVVTSVTPLVNYGGTLVGYAKQYPVLNFAGSHPDVIATAQRYSTQLGFAGTHPDIVALAQKDQKQIAEAQEFAPEIAVLSAHPALFTKLATYKNANKIPPALLNAAIKAAGGGAKGLSVLSTISANKVRDQRRGRARFRSAEDPAVRGPAHRAGGGADGIDRPGAAVRQAARRAAGDSAEGPGVRERALRPGVGGQRPDRRSVADLVLVLLRRDHLVPAQRPDPARPVAAA